MMARRLQKSRNRLVLGVAGGIADYFNIDPVIVRAIFILLVFANGVGILIYILLSLLMPKVGAETAETLAVVKENLKTAPRDATEAGRRVAKVLRGPSVEREEPQEKVSVQKDGTEIPS
jgi:phage shock protein C